MKHRIFSACFATALAFAIAVPAVDTGVEDRSVAASLRVQAAETLDEASVYNAMIALSTKTAKTLTPTKTHTQVCCIKTISATIKRKHGQADST